MNWLKDLFLGSSIAHTILIFALVIAAGIALGKIKIKGVSLGITFVLFVGIFAGHLGLKLNHEILHFMKEFGLILFVYSVGSQVGPGFFSSFKKGGFQLNMLATGVVFLGVSVTIILHFVTGIPMQTMVGIMSGAVTNTPGLGAAQEAYYDMFGSADSTIAMGYAVSYPLAVVGIIVSMIFIRYIFRVNIENENRRLQRKSGTIKDSVAFISLQVKNPSIFNKNIKNIAVLLNGRRLVVTRVLYAQNGKMEIASSRTVLNENDKIFVVTTPSDIETVAAFIGEKITMDQDDWNILDKQLMSKRIIVTRSNVDRKTISELNLRANFGVNITRVNRAGVDLIAQSGLKIQLGDRVTIVGDINAIQSASRVLGNQIKILNEPHLISIFVGIALGVVFGSIPFMIPGIPQPIKLGLAGGPLVVSILMSIVGRKYKLNTYTTASANLMLREIGICFFLACVGLGAGENFVDTIVNGGGYRWIAYGVIITMVPLLIIGVIGRKGYKLNYYTLMGLLSGSTTDPPALAYANSIAENDEPAISYASVYPLTMFLRVISAQLLILFFL